MNQRDDGNVVFFCGAGISVGTGLPNFPDLASELYARTGERPTNLEQDLLKRAQLDKVLGLLEERLVPGRLRKEVADRLSESPSGTLEVHEAIITLSRTFEGSVRLVTTNFDDRFERCVGDSVAIDAAPKLPIPKPHDWASIVHLHGRIHEESSASHLVITAADFGRAYLTERWASRFITELFRDFIVVFVGYSLNDPVLSYMVDALAAERARGARFQKAYAFADYKGGVKGKEQSEIAWRGKNVEPMLFHSRNRFARLNKTLVEWARICKDPLSTRRHIVLQGIKRLPGGNTGAASSERVCWALTDPVISEILGQVRPVDRESDYPKIAAWLEEFDKHGLLSRGASPPPGQASHAIPVVTNQLGLPENCRLDNVTVRLTYWLALHAHVPQILGWVARKGAYLHPALRGMLLRRLAKRPSGKNALPDIPDRLRLLWTVILNSHPDDHEAQLWSSDLLKSAKTDSERTIVENGILESLRPRLAIQPGPPSGVAFREYYDPAAALTPLEECAHLVLKLGDSDRWRQRVNASHRSDLLRKYAFNLTEYLFVATNLLDLDEEGFRSPEFYRPAIEDHEQNRLRDDWTVLIDWVRDSYFSLAGLGDGQAELLLQRWLGFSHILFRRLAVHVLTEDKSADIRLVRGILLSGEPLGLWNERLHHELLVFLRKAGHRLPKALLNDLVAAIKQGPKLEVEPGEVTNDVEQYRIWLTGLRLRKLAESGAELDQEANALADVSKVAADDNPEREEFRAWSGAAHWIGKTDYLRPGWERPDLNVLVEALRGEELTAEEFEAIAFKRPCTACLALQRLATQKTWPSKYWKRLIWAARHRIRNKKLTFHRERNLAVLLTGAPKNLFLEIDTAAADFIESFAKSCPTEDEDLLCQLWHRAWSVISDISQATDEDEVLTQAMNSAPGKLGEAALNRLWNYSPQSSGGMPEAVVHYFNAIASAPAGRLGRVMLVMQLSNLFAIDQTWTSDNLLPYMHWESSEEARDLWSAYAWSASAGPNLLDTFKLDFLAAIARYDEIGEQRSNLIHLFTAICLEEPAAFSHHAVRDAIRSLPEPGLIDIVYFMEEQLVGDPNNRANLWRRKIFPWLKKYWPNVEARNTLNTSLALVKCLLNSGEAFPEALKWASQFLRPGTDHVLWRVQESNVHTRFRDATLDMLIKIVPEGQIRPWEEHLIKELLDQMKEDQLNIETDPRFVTLLRRVTR